MISNVNRLQSALRRRDAKLRRKLRNQEEVTKKQYLVDFDFGYLGIFRQLDGSSW